MGIDPVILTFDLENQYSIGQEEWIVPQKKGKLIITDKSLDSAVSDEEFMLFRVRNNIMYYQIFAEIIALAKPERST